MKKIIIASVIMILLAAGAIGGYYYMAVKDKNQAIDHGQAPSKRFIPDDEYYVKKEPVTDANGNITEVVTQPQGVIGSESGTVAGKGNFMDPPTQGSGNQNQNQNQTQAATSGNQTPTQAATQQTQWPTYNENVTPGGGGATTAYGGNQTQGQTQGGSSSGSSGKIAEISNGTDGYFIYDRNSTGAVTITGYTGPGGAVTIPSTIGGYAVVGIGNEAFLGKSSITSITIPDSVVLIGYRAFAEICTNGSCTANLPTGCISVGDGAFTGIYVKNSNAYLSVEDGNVYKGSRLVCASGRIPNGYAQPVCIIRGGTTAIAPYAFANITTYGIIDFPSSLTYIGERAFKNCSNLAGDHTGWLVLPAGINYIEFETFRDTRVLKVQFMYATPGVVEAAENLWYASTCFPPAAEIYAADKVTRLDR